MEALEGEGEGEVGVIREREGGTRKDRRGRVLKMQADGGRGQMKEK